MAENKTKIIVVAGPTALGKTALGIEIAKAVGGEIICADSMQVYKNMPIATAAPTAQEKAEVPHHLSEFLDTDESFSVVLWCALAKKKIKEIQSRGNVPIIVGGTGLFIDSLVDNIEFENAEVNNALRQELMQRDNDSLYEELVRLDPQAARNIHKNNKKRVVRALELYYCGVTKTEQNMNSRKSGNCFDTLYFVLAYSDRQKLYDRINRRVDLMVQSGLVEEARENMTRESATASQAIGHKELFPYLNGSITLEDALDNLKRKTRNYAKRQITWFKRRDTAVFLAADSMDYNKLVNTAVLKCEDFLNG